MNLEECMDLLSEKEDEVCDLEEKVQTLETQNRHLQQTIEILTGKITNKTSIKKLKEENL